MEFDDSWCEGLSETQQNIIIRYVDLGCDIKLTSEYLKGQSEDSIQRFLRSPAGRFSLKKYLEFVLGETRETLEFKLIRQYMLMGFFDPADIITSDGDLTKELHALGQLSKVVDSIETTYDKQGNKIKKIKMVDRQAAMAQLAKYAKIMADSLEITGKDGNPLLDVWKLSRDERKKRLHDLQMKRKRKKKDAD